MLGEENGAAPFRAETAQEVVAAGGKGFKGEGLLNVKIPTFV